MSRIAVAQACSSDRIDENLDAIAGLVAGAADAGASAIFLPECCALMQSSREQLRNSAESFEDGVIQSRLSSVAADNNIFLFAGSLPLRSDDPSRVFNSSLAYDRDGRLLCRYDKIHLFDVTLENGDRYHESAYTKAGSETVNLDCALGNIGLSVCYDLRFPELYRLLAKNGAQILLVPSAFSAVTGPAHWQPLLRARAIENVCYVIAAAQTGTHSSGRKTWGHSLVIDPWGGIIAEKQTGTGLLMAEIDLNQVIRARQQMPSLDHRKL